MTEATTQPGRVLAADGTPLKRSLARALRMQKIRALMLVGQYGDHAMWGEAIYENEYLREEGIWKIAKLKAYQVFYTPYDKGWAVEVSPLLSEFGDFPPDDPIEPYPLYPEYFCPPFHYANPVSGRHRSHAVSDDQDDR